MTRATASPRDPQVGRPRSVDERPEIGLGDLAQAYALLRPEEAALGQAIAALLGLRPGEQTVSTAPGPQPPEEEGAPAPEGVEAAPALRPVEERREQDAHQPQRPPADARPIRSSVRPSS